MAPRTMTEMRSADGALSVEDFYAYPPTHSYIYVPCKEFWSAESVNSIFPPLIEYDKNGEPRRVQRQGLQDQSNAVV